MRWVPTANLLLVSLISYIDRDTPALLAPTLVKETHLTAKQYGFISALNLPFESLSADPGFARLAERSIGGVYRLLRSATPDALDYREEPDLGFPTTSQSQSGIFPAVITLN
jgi:hypothetical protein